MIATYLQRLQRILGDTAFERFNPFDLLEHINSARVFVALEGECCRQLCPSTAGVSSIQVTAGGTGYTSPPTVTLTPPGIGTLATATAFIMGGAVVFVQVDQPGSGYSTFNIPGISFSGGGGTGAAATATLAPAVQTVTNQEVYTFQSFNPILKGGALGADEIISVNSVAVSWGSMKPVLRRLDWGDFQAYLRSYNVAAQGYPRVWSLYQRGSQGSFYLWPIPAQPAQMDLDCIVTPTPLLLTNNNQIELIPKPWDMAVHYKAASTAVLGEPDLRDRAPGYADEYTRRMLFAAMVGGGQTYIPDFYNSAANA